MEPWDDRLTDTEIWSVVNYIRSLADRNNHSVDGKAFFFAAAAHQHRELSMSRQSISNTLAVAMLVGDWHG